MERAEVEGLVVLLVECQLEGGSVSLDLPFEAQGGDELDVVEVCMELEERLGIGLPDWSDGNLAEITPGFLVDEVVRVLGAAASKPTPEAPPASVAPDVTPAVCQGTSCGATPGGEHSPECIVEAAEAQGWGDAPEAVEARAKVAAPQEVAEENGGCLAGFISEVPIDRNALARASQTLTESLRLIFPGDKMHLLDEFFALHQNSERLIGLIGSKEFLGLTEEEQTLLTQQSSVMSEYQNILMRRIDICAAQAAARMNQQQAAGSDA